MRVFAEFDGLNPLTDGVVAVFGDVTDPLTTTTGSGSGVFLNDIIVNPDIYSFNLGAFLPLPGFETLNWDTWVTINATGQPSPGGLEAAGLVGDFTMTNSFWFIAENDPSGIPDANGRVLLGQFAIIQGDNTLPDLTLQWNIQVYGGGQHRGIAAEFGPRGVPAPGALALLGIVGFAIKRRRG